VSSVATTADTTQASTGVAPPVRLAIFTSHPIQYQAPLFRAIARTGRVHPTVYFGSRHGLDESLDAGFGTSFRWDVPLLEGYEHAFLTNVSPQPDVSSFRGVRLDAAEPILVEGQHDALLVLGWQTLAHVQMARAADALGLPLLVRGESTLERSPGAGVRALARRALWLPARSRLYRSAFAHVDAFLVIGSRNRAYYRSFGVPDEKLFWAPYGVDNEWFALAEPARTSARARIRAGLGVGDTKVVFASSAKLIERKRPFDLVDAVARLRNLGRDAHVLFIGEGEERQALEQLAADRGIAEHVSVAGFINQAELPAWYAASDVLVLPSDSRETWGLVVNEAMAAGLPVVVSDAAGCSPDLVRPGENGFTHPCGDVVALADRLDQLIALGPAGRAQFGEQSRAIVRAFGVDIVASTVADVAESVVRRAGGRRDR
jgi:glycosyltransferase involved in cell wall biosynthesis